MTNLVRLFKPSMVITSILHALITQCGTPTPVVFTIADGFTCNLVQLAYFIFTVREFFFDVDFRRKWYLNGVEQFR